MSSGYFHFAAFFIIILLMFVFFSKDRVNTSETKLYGYMLISSLIDTILELFILIVAANTFTPEVQVMLKIVNKIDFIHFIIWPSLLCLYVINISKCKDSTYNLIKKIILIIDAIFVVIEFLLPIELFNTGSSMGVTGASSTFILIVVGFYVLSTLISTVAFPHKYNKKYLPVFILLVMILVGVVARLLNPALLIMPAIVVYIDLVMYHTIENPDLKMINELNIARDTAVKANMAMSDFLSSMSHVIRNPLNAIVGFSEDICSHKDEVPSNIVDDAEDIMAASSTLLEIVGNILDISKIESNKMEVINTPYIFKKEIEDLVKVTSTRIGDKPINYSLNIASDIPYELIGDKGLVKEILNNLYTNAIKYTDKGSIDIDIKCINKDDLCYLIMSVKDTGRGIKPDKINRLFDKFDRLDAEKNTTVEGTGLGLAITKKLVEMMNGTINVQSNFGSGSIFVVNLTQKISKMTPPIVKDVIAPIEVDFGKKNILVVDDNNLNIKVASKMLSDYEFNIDTCMSGNECLDKVKENKYDLILMDIMMPGMNGEETLKKLKEDISFNTPVIALTADAVAGAKEKYISEGFIDYLAKPFRKEEIKEKLVKVFK